VAGVEVLDDDDRGREISRELGHDLEKGDDPTGGCRDRDDIECRLSL
jgi:hypothetical protein